MSLLPALSDVQLCSSGPKSSLAIALDILFEHSPILTNTLEPQLHIALESTSLNSWTQLVELSLREIAKWDASAQAEFISGHPRIGESSNLSKLSASEQGAVGAKPTPPEVLARLAHLNGLYEIKYPGLRYITFVDGRSRAAVADEMEGVLGVPHSLPPDEPIPESIVPVEVGSKEWKEELDRAVADIGRIAKSRLAAMGVE